MESNPLENDLMRRELCMSLNQIARLAPEIEDERLEHSRRHDYRPWAVTHIIIAVIDGVCVNMVAECSFYISGIHRSRHNLFDVVRADREDLSMVSHIVSNRAIYYYASIDNSMDITNCGCYNYRYAPKMEK
jgi:hypothetical protein